MKSAGLAFGGCNVSYAAVVALWHAHESRVVGFGQEQLGRCMLSLVSGLSRRLGDRGMCHVSRVRRRLQ